MRNFHFKTTFFIVFALLSTMSFSQKHANNWLFGDFGLEFKPDKVVIRRDYAVHENRGMGIISDSNGKLLCYTDGLTIWNKNHSIMPNGLNMSTTKSGSNVQTSTIIPKPGSTSIYYTFTVHTYNGVSVAGLYYSIIDLTKENGLGDVILKGKKIQNETDNKITAVYHNNGQDVWIITHQHNSNNFYAYLLTNEGLTETPVISTIGRKFSSGLGGQLKASPDGSMLACSFDNSTNVEAFSLFDFDNSSGKLTKARVFPLPVVSRGCHGLEFSPDGKKLYAYQNGSTGESALYQFDLSILDFDFINNSRTKLFQPMNTDLFEMQLAINGKIYFTKGGGSESGTKYLGVVQYPNEVGTDCSVNELGLYLDGASAFVAYTPTFIQNYFFKTSFKFSNACQGNLTDFQITNEAGLDSVRWDFGQGKSSVSRHPQYRFNTQGKHTVTIFAHYPTKTDTIQKQITINPSPIFDLGKDTSVCYGHELSAPNGFKSYLWNTGAQTQSIIITQSGGYKLTIENEFGCQTTDSVYLNVNALPIIDLPDSIQINNTDSILISPGIFKSYKWSTEEISSSIYIKNEGWYSITVQNETGCSETKSFYVYKKDQTTVDTNDWKLLNPLPTTYAGLDICFLNSQIGYILNQKEVLRTSDGGTSWKVLMEIPNGTRIAFKNNYGYIITNTGAIYKSTYMGVGWNKLNTGISDNLTQLSIISKDTVIVASNKKLYSTFDGGKNWSTTIIANTNINDFCFVGSNIGYLAGSNGNLYKTVDRGLTWIVKSSIGSVYNLVFVDSNTGFCRRGSSNELLKTTNGGESWNVISSLPGEIFSFIFLDSQNGFSAGRYGVLYKTINGGKSWDWIGFQNGFFEGTDINRLYFHDSLTGFGVGLSGRIMKTTDGGKTWNGNSPTYKTIKQLKIISNSTAYGLAGNAFIKSSDGCKTWKNMGAPDPLGNTNQFDFIDENNGYCIAGGNLNTSEAVGKVYKTTDGGTTWTITNGGRELMNDHLYSIDFIDETTGFASGGYNDRMTFKTTNGGTSWTKVNDFSFYQMQFLSPFVGFGRAYSKFYKTIDGGNTWFVLPVPTVFTGLASFDFTDLNNGYLLGDSYGEFFKTTDGGLTWQKITVPSYYYNQVKFHTPNIGYITEDYRKTYQTNNGGVSWSQVNKKYSVSGTELFTDEIYAFGENGVIAKKKIEYQPVILIANAASSIKNTSVTLTANVTSNKELIKNIQFEYGIGSLTNKVQVHPDSVQANASVNSSVNLKDLKSNQTYKYRLSAESSGILYTTEILQFRTLADYTMYMDNLYNPGSNDAKLTGYVVSNSSDITNIEFQYGTDTTFISKVPAEPSIISSGMSPVISANISSLKPQTRYYTRIKSVFNGKTVYSSIMTFNTVPTHEINIYNPNINGTKANFDVYIRANKDTIRNIIMEYGTTRDYKNKVNISGQIPKGTNNYVSTQLTELDSATVYYYRIKANMGNELIYSTENVLKLKKDIIMIPIEFKQLSDSAVVLQGLINPNGRFLSNIKFRYGMTKNLGDSAIATPNYVYNSKSSVVSSTLHHLTPGIEYYAILSAVDGSYKVYSEPFTFRLSVTGLARLTEDSEALIYPNPATDYLLISSLRNIDKVEITDLTGKTFITSSNETKINISQLQQGMYLIRIYLGDKVITKKMLKK